MQTPTEAARPETAWARVATHYNGFCYDRSTWHLAVHYIPKKEGCSWDRERVVIRCKPHDVTGRTPIREKAPAPPIGAGGWQEERLCARCVAIWQKEGGKA